MAVLTSTGVTLNDFWYEGNRVGTKRKVCDVTLVLSSQGGLTNNIPASLFGMTQITNAYGFRDTSSVRYNFGPNLSSTLNGTLLVAATVETNGNPADISVTVRGYVVGIEANA